MATSAMTEMIAITTILNVMINVITEKAAMVATVVTAENVITTLAEIEEETEIVTTTPIPTIKALVHQLGV